MPFIYWLRPNLSKPTFHYTTTPYERGHFMSRLLSNQANIISWNVSLLSSCNTSYSYGPAPPLYIIHYTNHCVYEHTSSETEH